MSFGRAGEVAIEFLRHFEAGSAWIAWVVAVGVLAFAWRRWRELLPALLPTIGVLVFLFVYYLHFREAGLADWIRWTMPRVSLSALGAALVGAAFTGAPSLTARVDPAEKGRGRAEARPRSTLQIVRIRTRWCRLRQGATPQDGSRTSRPLSSRR